MTTMKKKKWNLLKIYSYYKVIKLAPIWIKVLHNYYIDFNSLIKLILYSLKLASIIKTQRS